MALVKTEAAIATEEIVQLELAVYERYSRAGVLYTKQTESGRPQVYNFTRSQASILLQETEDTTGRPLWRKPRAVPTQVSREIERTTPAVIDATKDNTPVLEAITPVGRIDVGSEEELREILGDQADDLVTV